MTSGDTKWNKSNTFQQRTEIFLITQKFTISFLKWIFQKFSGENFFSIGKQA